MSGRIQVDGDVNLVLGDGSLLAPSDGIEVSEGNSITIWGQKNGTGSIEIEISSDNAAIGADQDDKAGTIVINGGVVSAKNDDEKMRLP